MSWKSLVSAGLLCVLASPVLAAPALSVVKGGTLANGHLDANGDWVWLVQIAPTNPLVDPTGTPLASELGFRETGASELLSAAIATPAVWDTANPGGSDAQQQRIFGWEALTDVDPGAALNERPVGLQVNLATDEVSSYYGSAILTNTNATNYLTIVVDGPKMGNLTTSLQWLGAYNAMGRIAELDAPGAAGACAFNSCNFDQYAGTAMRTAKAGDANLDGNVDGLDLAILADNFGQTGGKHWGRADYNGDNTDDGLDLAVLADNFGFTGPPPAAGAALGGSAVPEPATVTLLGLALLGGLGLLQRKR